MKRIIVAGSDPRMKYAKDVLKKRFETADEGFGDKKADGLLLPPVVKDSEQLSFILLNNLRDGGTVFGGKENETLSVIRKGRGLRYVNYMMDEELAMGNAVLTAEAALWTAMEQSGRAMWKSRALVTGFGRIASVLTARLIAMGAQVTVAARNAAQRARAEAMGAVSRSIPLGRETVKDKEVIFNTIPAEVFGREEIEALDEECILVDLASAPFGADETYVRNFNKKYVRATGLPTCVTG